MTMTELIGLHHLTAITSNAPKIFKFMTEVLGLHLIKKTVNQDDVSTYHLYFTDDLGKAGTDITFFDFPGIPKGKQGKNGITRIGFRVPNDLALEWWARRFAELRIEHTPIASHFGAKYLYFYDFDDQQYQLVSDEYNHGLGGGDYYRYSPIPEEYAIVGLGPTFVTVNYLDKMDKVLTELMGFEKIDRKDDLYLYELHQNGHGAQVIIEDSQIMPDQFQGYGTVHHLAFALEDEDALHEWIKKVKEFNLPDSGFVDRFYFKSEYFRPGNGVLFELATNGPGFLLDETYEEAGVHLELPPFLEAQRAEIEANLVPFNTESRKGK